MNLYLFQKNNEIQREERLRECLSHFNNERGLALTEATIRNTPIQKETRGKPFFEELEGIYFSVSHSAELWACAFAHFPIGFDLEKTSTRMNEIRRGQKEERFKQIAKRFFLEEEYSYVCQEGSKAFFRIWVRKEAFVKYLGENLAFGLEHLNLVKNGELCNQTKELDFLEIDLNFTAASEFEAVCCFAKRQKIKTTIYLHEPPNGFVRKGKNVRQ